MSIPLKAVPDLVSRTAWLQSLDLRSGSVNRWFLKKENNL
jgi:hypothetical protein